MILLAAAGPGMAWLRWADGDGVAVPASASARVARFVLNAGTF